MKAPSKRDLAVANEFIDRNEALMCKARGCPGLWSVDAGGGRLCSSHAWGDPDRWPEITELLIEAQFQRSKYAEAPKAPPRRLTLEQKRAIGQRLRQALKARGGKEWAQRLRQREESGEKLTDTQRSMWRAAFGPFQAYQDEPQEVHP